MPLMRLGEPGEVVVNAVGLLLPVPYLAWLAVGVWGVRGRSAIPLMTLGWFGSQLLIGLLVASVFVP